MSDSGSRFPVWSEPKSAERLVVLATSAGGIAALCRVLSTLPPDFPAPIAVISHRGDSDAEILPRILAKHTRLWVRNAVDGDVLRPGVVYVCPPGVHMVVETSLRLVEGPRIGFVRPSADLMLHSVARSHGSRAICVVLTGSGSDAAVGAAELEGAGAALLVQDPIVAEFPWMPRAALRAASTSQVVPLDEIGTKLQELLRAPVPSDAVPTPGVQTRVILADDHGIIRDGLRSLLSTAGDLQVVGEASDGHMAVSISAELLPDVVVMDVAMPDLDGIEATRQIKAHNARTRIVALSAGTDATLQDRMLQAGASSYLSKELAFTHLVDAIRATRVG